MLAKLKNNFKKFRIEWNKGKKYLVLKKKKKLKIGKLIQKK